MSAHFKVSEIGFFSLDHWLVTVCAWRGCCIEVFSRAEHSVADCLDVLRVAGLGLSKDAQHQGAVARLRALDDCLSRFSFVGHEKKARQRIETWQKLCENRTFLAHAKLTATKIGITIEPINLAPKKEVATPPKALTRIEMLEFLAELEQAQMLLHQQLGHIKAKAAEATPIIVS
jgi:hypothetical protein